MPCTGPAAPIIGGNYIWLAESPDLIHWGNHRCIARTPDGMWDSVRVGAGAAPIRTPEGWLEIYHGATSNIRYCLGALLLDIREPWKVLGPIAGPDHGAASPSTSRWASSATWSSPTGSWWTETR